MSVSETDKSKLLTLVTGATGLVGQSLLARLQRPIVVCRDRARAGNLLRKCGEEGSEPSIVEWDSSRGPILLGSQPQIEAVVNLMGAPIAARRWTQGYKESIRASRVDGTKNLIEGLIRANQLPRVFVSASAVGIYGDRADEILTEDSSPGPSSFLVDVCRAWESEALKLIEHGIRVVILRIGIVISTKGGALKEMLPIFKYGLGGRLGNGKQWMSWVHISDLVQLIEFVLHEEQIKGIVNAVAPHPIRNREFAKALGSQLHRPTVLPAPAFGLRLGLGEFANTLLESQRAIPQRILEAGFEFRHPDLSAALAVELA
ncbi:MAG TPA: TIGR01777 family oxidoreductase [Pirellulaceae bacterium]|nr:TIGR01777 family oxidoreductase [Pirellulaceae bacterium]HMO94116.1 TIGR01777 family oxidoreductase [Pirellulaceae bacterium]HMP71043.1 TIGR01777 family oxidoreductase [Pirellulaceae bacterium]